MHNVHYFLLSILIVLFILALACTRDPCPKIDCKNSGTTYFDSGTCFCICKKSTAGSECEINFTDSIEGRFTQYDSCSRLNLATNITRIDSNVFSIPNLGSYTGTLGMYSINFKTLDTIVKIDSQYVLPASENYLFFGKGIINYSNMSVFLRYYVNYLNFGIYQTDSCEVIFTKN